MSHSLQFTMKRALLFCLFFFSLSNVVYAPMESDFFHTELDEAIRLLKYPRKDSLVQFLPVYDPEHAYMALLAYRACWPQLSFQPLCIMQEVAVTRRYWDYRIVHPTTLKASLEGIRVSQPYPNTSLIPVTYRKCPPREPMFLSYDSDGRFPATGLVKTIGGCIGAQQCHVYTECDSHCLTEYDWEGKCLLSTNLGQRNKVLVI